jgi:glycosyltransferase involved in cell wall biosynthesis
MNKNKLKILMCSEASFLSSGFAVYAKELLSRLHATQKYEIAEFASYGNVNDPRDISIKWKYYANAVSSNDSRANDYNSRIDNQFGRWRFEKVLLDFKPDVVIDVRDYWMSAYQALSPLRPYFHWILMPTVDSEPQQESWLDTYLSADAIFTYSDWGAEVLKKQTSNKINHIATAAPGVDLSVFKPQSQDYKRSLKEKLKIPIDSIILGSVMRNQKRKLIPDLFLSFRNLLDICEKKCPELGSKLYLYLHTSYPDAGWDLPELLKEHRISNKVILTYICRKCKNFYSRTFGGPTTGCSHCGESSCQFTSVTQGITSQQLSDIYNLFDCYIQYAICEGAGMPQVEAGACGLPVFTVEYSAMIDIIEKLGATPIKVKSYFKELETKAIRVYPDNEDLVQKLYRFLFLADKTKKQLSNNIRKLTADNYSWDNCFKKWEKYLDELDSNYRSDWDRPMSHMPNISIPPNYSSKNNFELLMHISNNIFNNHNMLSSMVLLNMLKDIDYGFIQSGMSIQASTVEDTIETINVMIHNSNASEKVRRDGMVFEDDFIKYANMKGST